MVRGALVLAVVTLFAAPARADDLPPGVPPDMAEMMKRAAANGAATQTSSHSSSSSNSSSTTTVGNTVITSGHSGSTPGAVRFEIQGDMVQDTKTGLRWQRAIAPRLMKPSEAAGYCSGLSLNGTGGWHLPSEDELISLLDTSKVPTLDSAAFPGVQTGSDASKFWSSTPSSKGSDLAKSVDFSNGFIRHSANSYAYSVRCAHSR